MTRKTVTKMMVDLLMTILLLLLMGYHYWGDDLHEWFGAAIFLLFIIHHVLNIQWYKNLPKGKYSLDRVFRLIINFLLFAAMIGLMISGIMMSRHVFAFLNIDGNMSFARQLHMASNYWGFVIMSLHIGLHWRMLMNMFRKKGSKPSAGTAIVKYIIGAGVAVYGLYVFFQRRLLDYMLLRTMFVFLDFGESKVSFYLDYLAMMGCFIFISSQISLLLSKCRKKS
nr:DUF4405 domain-containing protein [uncultured Anaerostipes sp.]